MTESISNVIQPSGTSSNSLWVKNFISLTQEYILERKSASLGFNRSGFLRLILNQFGCW